MTPKEQQIVSLKNRYNEIFGIPKSPMDVAKRMVDMGRQMGKTRILIEALPADGKAIIIVWNTSSRDHMKTMIRDVRGADYPVRELVFITYQQWKKEQVGSLRGIDPRPAFIDNAVYDMLNLEISEWINNLINLREPECLQSTPTTTASSEKSSKKSRTKSKPSATETT